MSQSVTARTRLFDDFTRLLVGLFLAPVPFELAVGIAKKEEYDFRRLFIILALLTALSILLVVLRRREWFMQSIVGYYLILVGLAMAALGVTVTVWDDAIRDTTEWSAGIEITVSALSPSLGALLIIAGIYLIWERRRRARQELDTPSPPNITDVRAGRPVGGKIWRAAGFLNHKGADRLVEICQGQLSPVDLHFVAFYTPDMECLFYVDLLDHTDLDTYDIQDTGERREMYVQHGRHLRYLTSKLDKRFSGLESGDLVRTVLDVERGALFLYRLGDRGNVGFLLGVTLNQTQVDPTDWKMSSLANYLLVARGARPDDDFYRLCPKCGKTNDSPHRRGGDDKPPSAARAEEEDPPRLHAV